MADPIALTPNQIADSNPKIANNQTPVAVGLTDAQIAAKNALADSHNPGGSNPNPTYVAAQNLGNQHATGINTTANGTGSVISSSAPVIANENQTIQNVQDATGTNPQSIQAHNDYVQGITDQTAALETQRTNTINQINTQFDQKNTALKGAQAGETGTFTATLARIGGYLGDSASATGAMINLNNTHVAQVNDLESKRQDALQAANNAINDKQFALASAKMSEAENYAKDIQTNKQTFFDNQIKILNQQKAATDARDQAAKDQAITSLLAPTDGSAPITDPTQIVNKLSSSGLNITSADVAATMKNIADANGINSGTLTGDVNNFTVLQKAGKLPPGITTLPQYLKMLHQSSTNPAADTSTKPLGVTEIGQYQVDYPDAGIKEGDTLATATAKIAALNAPKIADFTGATISGLDVILADGSKLTFPNQQALEQFKSDNGLSSGSSSASAPAPAPAPAPGKEKPAKKAEAPKISAPDPNQKTSKADLSKSPFEKWVSSFFSK